MSAMPVSLGSICRLTAGTPQRGLQGLNALAQIRELLAGFERLDGLLRLDGLVACSPMFTEHATVLNGASDLFVEVLGDRGWHARSAAGVISLPMNAAVELVVTFAISDAACRAPQFDCRGHWDRCHEDFGNRLTRRNVSAEMNEVEQW